MYANITYPTILSLLVFSLLNEVDLKIAFIQITYLVENNFWTAYFEQIRSFLVNILQNHCTMRNK